jgi:hypothetical protein
MLLVQAFVVGGLSNGSRSNQTAANEIGISGIAYWD